MLDLYESPSDLFFKPDCGVLTGEFLPEIQPIEARAVSSSCENRFRENIITCKDPYRNEFLEEVGGLSFDLGLSTQLPDIPNYIPILDFRTIRMTPQLKNTPVVGVTLRDILSSGISFKAGRMHFTNNVRIRKTILSELLNNKQVILFLSGSDTLIESVWQKRTECDLFSIICDMGFWAVTGFNFSVIDGECAFAQVLNLKRSLFSAHLMEQNGLQVIPHIYAVTSQQQMRWVTWLEKNPAISYFTMNCQLQKSRTDIQQVVSTVATILTARPNIHAILQGFPIRETIAFGSDLKRIHIAESQPIKYAQSHKLVLAPGDNIGSRYEFRYEKSIAELMNENIEQRKDLLSRSYQSLL